MRLASIRLSGFKSFVDNTTVPFPGDLVGVVGPNGCGKSNIIDGVRWVLGESSAKNLRGDQIADVIFNGSNTRPPSSQATIELKFENALGKLRGDFAKYNEISVRRQVNSEGISTYYINNIRCRRKDIVDTFLGTGLGSRSYSIIQQGTISRLVEAKPEELRQYLEEAAGISHYKERRRETENRMRSTRENLERLVDICDELGKRLRALSTQAANARKYKELSTELATFNSQMLALQWSELNDRVEQLTTRQDKAGNRLESQIGKLREIEARQEQLNQQKQAHQQDYQRAQQAYYSTEAGIARTQEQIQSLEQRQKTLQDEQQQLEQRRQQLLGQKASDQAQTQDLEQSIKHQQEKLQQHNTKLSASHREYIEAEKDYRALQLEWDKFQSQSYEQRQQSELDQYRIQQLEEQMVTTEQELAKLVDTIPDELAKLSRDQSRQHQINQALDGKITEQHKLLAEIRQRLENSEQSYQQQAQQLQMKQREQQICEGRIASYTTLLDQKTQTGKSEQLNRLKTSYSLNQWIDQAQVAPGWESAIEQALTELLIMQVSDNGALLEDAWEQIEDATAAVIIEQGETQTADAPDGLYNCAEIITGPLPDWMQSIYFAEDPATALRYISNLQPWQQIVCKNGTSLGSNWIISRDQSREDPLLVTRAKLTEEQAAYNSLSEQITSLEQHTEQHKQTIQENREAYENQQKTVHQLEQQRVADKARLEQLQHKTDLLQKQHQKNLDRTHQLNESNKQAAKNLEDVRERWSKGIESIEFDNQKRIELQDRRSFLSKRREQIQATFSKQQSEAGELRVKLQEDISKQQYLNQSIEKLDRDLVEIDSRTDRIKQQARETDDQPARLNEDLRQMLDQQLALQKDMQKCHSAVNEQDQKIQQTNEQHKENSGQIEQTNSKIQELQLKRTELVTRQQTLLEQLDGTDPRAIAKTLPEQANVADWKQEIQKRERKIQTLGEVNHAAIKDYETEKERKEHLDKQREEIEKALTTLQNTISSIDKETRNTFRDTFDKVNSNLQNLFPRLIGGGTVKLEMTSNDLLTTGVTIIARPPGKRNTSISMLSGGEKAMTAIALVFAIFQLNPAPFCMLDEVDAPLDDVNTDRYIRTVRSMSEKVQFILVTHSKITMERLDQLLGITMSEAGVSRVVSVDINKAVALAS